MLAKALNDDGYCITTGIVEMLKYLGGGGVN